MTANSVSEMISRHYRIRRVQNMELKIALVLFVVMILLLNGCVAKNGTGYTQSSKTGNTEPGSVKTPTANTSLTNEADERPPSPPAG